MKKIIIKGLLSIFIVYHLIVIVVLANGSSFLGRSLQSYIIPYANAIGLNNTWNFFAPDPAHTMYFKYSIYYNEDQEPTEGFYPPEKTQIVTDSSQRRFLYAMRFLIIDPKRIELLLGPWACREYKGAQKVFFQHIIESIPSLDAASTSVDTSMSGLTENQNYVRQGYDCKLGEAIRDN